jgi:hypothetical protein
MSRQRRHLIVRIGIACVIALLSGTLSGPVRAHDTNDRDDPSLVGTWRVTISFPGVPIEFYSLETFHDGGTMTDFYGESPRFGPYAGVWKRIRGQRHFAATFEDFFDGDSDGSYDGRFRVRLTLHMLDADTFVGTATIDTLTLDGTTATTAPFPGTTVRATRMKVVRE